MNSDYIISEQLFANIDYTSFFADKIIIYSPKNIVNKYVTFSDKLTNTFKEEFDFTTININSLFLQRSYQKIAEYCQFLAPQDELSITEKIDDTINEMDSFDFLKNTVSQPIREQLNANKYYVIFCRRLVSLLIPIDDFNSITRENIGEWLEIIIHEYDERNIKEFDVLNFQPCPKEDDDGEDIHSKLNSELRKIELEFDNHIEALRANDLDFIIAKVLMKHYSEKEIPRLFATPDIRRIPPVISRLYITNNYKIYFTHYNDKELILPPIQKALYILFIKHNNGIMIKEIGNYKSELSEIYALLSNKSELSEINETIDKLCNPFDNSLNEKCSKINASIYKLFDKPIAKEYCITGSRNQPKYIPVAKGYNVWWQHEIENMTLEELENLDTLDKL